MQLPGGTYDAQGEVNRALRFKHIDGVAELAMWQAGTGDKPRLGCIDRLIDCCVALGAPAASLSVADRQYVLAALASRLGHDQFWISSQCRDCESRFDARVDLSKLPAKPAGATYPFATATIAAGSARLRVPTGRDQAAIADITDTFEAIAALARHCIVSNDVSLADDPERLADDIEAIDAALQEVAPEVATSVSTECPDCGYENTTPFDIAALLISRLDNPLEDVHEIASIYHWSETEILSLPRQRRQDYLDLIDRDQHMQR